MQSLGSFVFIFVLALAVFKTRGEFTKIGYKNYYIERDLQLNWHEAWDYCISNNMTLIKLETDLETRLIKEVLGDNVIDFWTSGNENANPTTINNHARKFVWAANGSPFTYTNWAYGEPNNFEGRSELCVATWYKKLEWNDESCYTKLYFICEY